MTDHPDRQNEPRMRDHAPLSPDELAHWRERVAAAPAVRLPHVLRVRRALADSRYEADRIDRVVEAISADLALLWTLE